MALLATTSYSALHGPEGERAADLRLQPYNGFCSKRSMRVGPMARSMQRCSSPVCLTSRSSGVAAAKSGTSWQVACGFCQETLVWLDWLLPLQVWFWSAKQG